MDMLEFVGRLAGMSLRFKASLPFLFPSIIWKQLCGQRVDEEDLMAMDSLTGQAVYAIDKCDQAYTMDGERHEPITNEADFRAAFGDIYFVCNSSTGEEVELMAGGGTTRVTFANRKRYVKMAVDYRLHEFDLQVAAIRRGIASVVPMPALRLFTWQELEILVAGRPEIDLEVLKRQTSYSGCVA